MKHQTRNKETYEGDKCENERYEVEKINNSMEKNDDDMMNLPNSLHGEDMSSKNWIMNMTLTRSL